jgi:hypothetical protein
MAEKSLENGGKDHKNEEKGDLERGGLAEVLSFLVPVAQLDRALASEAKGYWFDSSRG